MLSRGNPFCFFAYRTCGEAHGVVEHPAKDEHQMKTGWRIGILLSGLCLALGTARAGTSDGQETKRGLKYWGNDPYAALSVAKQQRKLLLVEFYADWDYRSRWMSERVLSDSTVRSLIEAEFLAVQVPTDTPDGADLAQMYQVTAYPSIVVFNTNGDVVDKIDTTLDAEDFEQRLQAILMTTQGAGAWQMRQVYSAAENGDTLATDQAMEEFLAGQLPTDVATSICWPLFENGVVNRFGSPAFDYLEKHVSIFRQQLGAGKVDPVLTETLLRAMLAYTVGSAPFQAEATQKIVTSAHNLGLSAEPLLQSMAEVAELRGSDELTLYVARLGLLMDQVPESYQLPLAISLEVVAERGDKEARNAAARIVNHVRVAQFSVNNATILEELGERLK